MATPNKQAPKAPVAAPAPANTAKPVIESGIPAPQTTGAVPVTADAAKFAASVKPPLFEIEDNIPIPARKAFGRQSTGSIYPFEKLNIGQSFFVPVSDKSKEPWKTLTSMSSRMNRDMHPKSFRTARMTGKDGVDGVRVFREADTTEPVRVPVLRGPRKPKEADAAPAATQAAPDPFAAA